MFNAISSGANAGLNVLSTILSVMVFFLIIWGGPKLFKRIVRLISNLVEILEQKTEEKLMEKKEPELQELNGTKSEIPTFEEFEEWMKWKQSRKT